MRKILKKFEMTIVFLLKTVMYALLFLTFFYLFSLRDWQILTISRTMAITVVGFIFVEVVMTSIYGAYDIGKRKSKPIIFSVSLATIITDLFTYLLLQIMNTNPNNNASFRLENIWILILVVVIQLFIIVCMTYMGNYVFFVINPPEKCVVITDCQDNLNKLAAGINHYKKQYQITKVLDYRTEDILKKIRPADTVFMYNVPTEIRTQITDYCYRSLINVYYNPEISDVVELNSKHVMLDDVSLVGEDFKDLTLEQKFLKRTLDILLSLFCILLTSPIFAICALAVKLDDGGRVFFTQKRATRGGVVFKMIKFRTMKENVENYSAKQDDDRITRVGRVLRKYRLDEIPQLFNILFGKMSCVGPRPEMLSNVYSYTKELPEFRYRLRVKAGLTGYAQINGKYNTSPKDKLILDLMYIESYSVWKDLQLLFQTAIVLLKSEDSTEGFKELGDCGIKGDFKDE